LEKVDLLQKVALLEKVDVGKVGEKVDEVGWRE